MTHRKLIFVSILVVLLAASVYGSALAVKKPFTQELVVWEITNPQVINPGQTVENNLGTLTSGYIVQAKAKAKHNNVIPEGTIVLNLSAFTPKREMPGQSPGIWYVQGNWLITKKNAIPESVGARHSPDKAQGFIKTELRFNPLTTPGDWSGLAWLPMSPAAGLWSSGQGSITLNSLFEGTLLLDLSRLPAVQ